MAYHGRDCSPHSLQPTQPGHEYEDEHAKDRLRISIADARQRAESGIAQWAVAWKLAQRASRLASGQTLRKRQALFCPGTTLTNALADWDSCTRLLAMVRRMTHGDEDAEGNTLLRLVELAKREKHDPLRGELNRFVRGVVSRILHEQFRRQRHDRRVPVKHTLEGFEEALADKRQAPPDYWLRVGEAFHRIMCLVPELSDAEQEALFVKFSPNGVDGEKSKRERRKLDDNRCRALKKLRRKLAAIGIREI